MPTNRSLVYGWIATFLLGLLLTPGFNSFETPEADVLERFLKTGTIAMEKAPHDLFLKGHDGRYYPSHELGSNIAALPIAVVALWISSRVPSLRFDAVFELLCGFAAAAVFGLTCVLCVRLCCRLGTPPAFAWRSATALLIGSQYLIYGLHLADVSLASPCFVLAAILITDLYEDTRETEGTRGTLWRYGVLGLVCSIVVVLKLTNAAFVAGVLVFLASHVIRGRAPMIPAAVAFAAGALPFVIVNGWWNWFRSGSPLHAIYEDWQHGFRWVYFGEGLPGTLVSPGKGLIAYSPFLIVSVFLLIRTKGALGVVTKVVLGTLGFAIVRLAGTWAWSSFGGWGNRYYVPWIPVLAALTAVVWWHNRERTRTRAALIVLVGAGVVVNLAGALTNFQYRQQICGIIYPWTLSNANFCALDALPSNLARTAGIRVPEIVVSGASADNVFVSNRLNVWWFSVRRAGVPPMVSWLIGLLLAASAAFGWRRLLRSAEPSSSNAPV